MTEKGRGEIVVCLLCYNVLIWYVLEVFIFKSFIRLSTNVLFIILFYVSLLCYTIKYWGKKV